MAYAGLTAFIDQDDKRSHRDWVVATLYERHHDLWQNEDLIADMAMICDAAVERVLRSVRDGVQGGEDGGGSPAGQE